LRSFFNWMLSHRWVLKIKWATQVNERRKWMNDLAEWGMCCSFLEGRFR
jgi:hypothetical protein